MSETTPTAETTVEETPTLPAWTPPASPDEFNKIIQDRIARERAKYADYDELKKAAAELDKLRDLEKTELQRSQEEAEAARKEADMLRVQARNAAVYGAVKAAAAANNAVNPDQVLRLIDTSDVTVAEDGSVDIGSRVSDFLAENPHLVRSGTPHVAAAPGTSTQNPVARVMTMEEIARLDPRELADNPALFAQVLEARRHWEQRA